MAPDPVWEAAQRIADQCHCTVNDLLQHGAERTLTDPDYAETIRRAHRLICLPLGEWPADPIDCLLVAWLLAETTQTAVPGDAVEPDPASWWKDSESK